MRMTRAEGITSAVTVTVMGVLSVRVDLVAAAATVTATRVHLAETGTTRNRANTAIDDLVPAKMAEIGSRAYRETQWARRHPPEEETLWAVETQGMGMSAAVAAVEGMGHLGRTGETIAHGRGRARKD